MESLTDDDQRRDAAATLPQPCADCGSRDVTWFPGQKAWLCLTCICLRWLDEVETYRLRCDEQSTEKAETELAEYLRPKKWPEDY